MGCYFLTKELGIWNEAKKVSSTNGIGETGHPCTETKRKEIESVSQPFSKVNSK